MRYGKLRFRVASAVAISLAATACPAPPIPPSPTTGPVLITRADSGEVINGHAVVGSISGDMSTVSFSSYVWNAADGQLPEFRGMYIRDIATGVVQSVDTGFSLLIPDAPILSQNGRYAWWRRTTSLFPGQSSAEDVVRDVASGVETAWPDGSQRSRARALTNDGRFATSGRDPLLFDGVCLIRDVNSGSLNTCRDGLDIETAWVNTVATGADGEFLVFDAFDGAWDIDASATYRFEIRTGALLDITSFAVGNTVTGISDDGRYIARSATEGQAAARVDLATGQVEETSLENVVEISADGSKLAAFELDEPNPEHSGAYVWDVAAGEVELAVSSWDPDASAVKVLEPCGVRGFSTDATRYCVTTSRSLISADVDDALDGYIITLGHGPTVPATTTS